MFNSFKVVLTNDQNEFFDLTYRIHQNVHSQIWAKCVSDAQAFGFKENYRFYNFSDPHDHKLTEYINELKKTIHLINNDYPEIIFPEIQMDKLQQILNQIHSEFVHSDKLKIKKSDLWDSLNILCHKIESHFLSQRSVSASGIPDSRIVMTWKNPFPIDIPEKSYEKFSLNYTFGNAYVNYAHIGRHFLEIFRSQDNDIFDEQIVPSRLISADTSLWFGPTFGHSQENQTEHKIKLWFKNNEEKFNKLGYFWGDPKIALGHLCVASLDEQIFSAKETKQFINRISVYNKVLSAKVY